MGLLIHFITYLLEIIMDTNAIINAAMQQLVDTVADAVIRKLKAEGSDFQDAVRSVIRNHI